MFLPHEHHLRRKEQRKTAHLQGQLARLENIALAAFESGYTLHEKHPGDAAIKETIREEWRAAVLDILNEPVPKIDPTEHIEHPVAGR